MLLHPPDQQVGDVDVRCAVFRGGVLLQKVGDDDAEVRAFGGLLYPGVVAVLISVSSRLPVYFPTQKCWKIFDRMLSVSSERENIPLREAMDCLRSSARRSVGRPWRSEFLVA